MLKISKRPNKLNELVDALNEDLSFLNQFTTSWDCDKQILRLKYVNSDKIILQESIKSKSLLDSIKSLDDALLMNSVRKHAAWNLVAKYQYDNKYLSEIPSYYAEYEWDKSTSGEMVRFNCECGHRIITWRDYHAPEELCKCVQCNAHHVIITESDGGNDLYTNHFSIDNNEDIQDMFEIVYTI